MIVAHGRHVVVLRLAADAVHQQLLGHRRDEHIAAREHRLAQAGGPVDRRAVHELAGRVDLDAFVRQLRQRPMASKFSSDRPIGSMILWQPAHAGLARCCSMRSRTDFGVAVGFSSSGGTSGGGVGAGLPSRFSRIHLPRMTGDVRLAFDVTSSRLPWPEQAATRVDRHRHAAEVGAVDVRDAVVPGEPLVDERVVGIEQIEHRRGPRA